MGRTIDNDKFQRKKKKKYSAPVTGSSSAAWTSDLIMYNAVVNSYEGVCVCVDCSVCR